MARLDGARRRSVDELELQGKERLPGICRRTEKLVIIACGLVREATTLLFQMSR